MGRISGFFLGIIGLVLPSFLIHKTVFSYEGPFSVISSQGFFYEILYSNDRYGFNGIRVQWLNTEWFTVNYWKGNIELYLYIISFALTIIGLIVILKSKKGDAYLILAGGVSLLALLVVLYTNLPEKTIISNQYPIPLGAIFLILGGLMELKE